MPNLSNLLRTSPGRFAGVTQFLAHFVDDISDPTRQDVLQFLKMAEHFCRTRSQHTALLNISRLLFGSGPLAFRALHRCTLTYQLARRILDPTKFDQKEFGLCGPTALAVFLCRDDPVAFAKFAVDLAQNGRGALRAHTITPAMQVLSFDPSSTTIAEADFMMLASLLDSQSALTATTNFATYDGTGLSWMFDWFVKAGYPAVLQVMVPPSSGMLLSLAYKFVDTFQRDKYVLRCHPNIPGIFGVSGLNYHDKKEVLMVASFLCAAGWKVAISGGIGIAASATIYNSASGLKGSGAPSSMVSGMEQQAREKLRDDPGKHWVIAESIEISGGRVSFKVLSWTKVHTVDDISLDDFLYAFDGFVAASPLDIRAHRGAHH